LAQGRSRSLQFEGSRNRLDRQCVSRLHRGSEIDYQRLEYMGQWNAQSFSGF
jgi:hypothetical protein